MSDLYPYCSKCDKELNEEEKALNRKYENFFYPVCNTCLNGHIKKIMELALNDEEEE